MSKLYRIEVTDRILAGGVSTYMSAGDAIDVDGEPMVRVFNVIVPADGWHDTLQAAQAAAAERIAEIGRKVTQQADCLREAARG